MYMDVLIAEVLVCRVSMVVDVEALLRARACSNGRGVCRGDGILVESLATL